jgi:polyhydroxyalkanoate synthesis regulator phasin
MAQGWRQYLEAGMQVGEMTRAQAQKLVQELVREGQLAESRARGYADELVKRSRKRTEELTKLVQREVGRQLSSLGLATKEDLAKLEKKLAKATASKSTSNRSRPATKSTS